MNNKFKLALVAAAALFTASAVYAGPHHWGNWDGPNCPYADGFGPADFGPGHGPRHHRGMGFGPGAGGPGMGPSMMGMRGPSMALECPYMKNLIDQAGLSQDYQKVLSIKDAVFAKRQVLKALVANSQDAASIEKASNEFTQARRTLQEAKQILWDKLSAKYPQGLPTPAMQNSMPK